MLQSGLDSESLPIKEMLFESEIIDIFPFYLDYS